jgi:hypothetical protein
MFATVAQLAGLAGLVAAGIIIAGVGGFILGVSVVCLYVGLAADRSDES